MINKINDLLVLLGELENALQENNHRRVGSIMAQMRFILDEVLSLLKGGGEK